MEIKIRFGVHKDLLQVYAKGEGSKQEKYKSLSFFWGKEKKIKTPCKYWNGKEQRFQKNIVGATEDNKNLKTLREELEEYASAKDFSSPDDFFTSYQKDYLNTFSDTTTLLEFAIKYRNMWKDGKIEGIKDKTGNYKCYDKLIHKLQGLHNGKEMSWAGEAQKFANLPIAAINSKDFEAWAKFIIKNDLGWKDSIKNFRAAVYYYHHNILNNASYKLDSVDNLAPRPKTKQEKKDFTFSEKEINIIKTCDLSEIECKGVKSLKTKNMLRDVLVLVYGLCSRPCDIISMRIEDLQYNKEMERWFWAYCPRKLVNTTGEILANKIEPNFYEIISKYKGNRKKGFVFPFTCNQKDEEWQKRKAGVNHVATDCGYLLKGIAKAHSFSVKDPTSYNMRKTGITMLCRKTNLTNDKIAVFARTSSREIDKVYRDKAAIAKGLDLQGVL